ncbi:hypothetical protein HYZ98_02055 [Candidatus Peregrinibacteria bacterium]|nr:hypothetical protein [Candidatus Peregrinibacteria bacterium]
MKTKIVLLGFTFLISASVVRLVEPFFPALNIPLLTAQTDSSHRSRRAAAEQSRMWQIGAGETTWIDGEDIRYYSTLRGYRFERPYRWQARSMVEYSALQSAGFTPFPLDEFGSLKHTDKPSEEIVIIVRSALGKTLSAIVDPIAATTPVSITLGDRPALRYQTGDSREIVTAVFNNMQYDLVLMPVNASERLKNTYERAIASFKFIDHKLRVL